MSARDSDAVVTDASMLFLSLPRGTCRPVRYGESYEESRHGQSLGSPDSEEDGVQRLS
jgi:hypothetical protein